jgi:DNA-binding transcriptional LysR family regulator
MEHVPVLDTGMPDWQDLRLFLELDRRGSFRAAANVVGLSINTLRRRIDDLEARLGMTLLTRHADGIRLTAEGESILAATQSMEAAAYSVLRARDAVSATPAGCTMDPADVARLEAEIAVQLVRPVNPDLKVVKLGRLHVMAFAARSYLDIYGVPASIEDAARHRIVLQVSGQTVSMAEYDRHTPGMPQSGYVTLKTNVSSAHYWSVANGAGIGWLPTYASAIGARLVPIDGLVQLGFDIWLTYHPDAERIDRVRRAIDWIRASFDPVRYPWFRDTFIHPRDLPAAIKGGAAADLFGGFAGMER